MILANSFYHITDFWPCESPRKYSSKSWKLCQSYVTFSLPEGSQNCPGEGNGTPLQYSCLENPMDGGAWKAAVHGVAEGRTRLSDCTFTFHFHALEKEMATHSSVTAWRIPGKVFQGIKSGPAETSLVVQWLRLWASSAQTPCTLVRELRVHMLQLKTPHAATKTEDLKCHNQDRAQPNKY